MSSYPDEKKGWKKIREGIDRTNKIELDIINDQDANPTVRDCLALGVGLTDLTGKQIKKIKPRNRK